jgi:hypothetical protein
VPPANTQAPAQGQGQGQGQQGQGLAIPGLGNLPVPNGLPNPNGAGSNGASPGEGPVLPIPIPGAIQGTTPPVPARGSLAAAPAGSYDARGHMTPAFLAAEAERIHQALVAALAEGERRQVEQVPFHVASEASEPNAAAGCVRGTRAPVMFITQAMLTLAAGISETRAYDELAGSSSYDSYAQEVVSRIRGGGTLPGVPDAMVAGPQATDPHKLSRQLHLFDQQVAFILGHELAHHYRGHTTCAYNRSASQQEMDQLTRVASRVFPTFGQPREIEADMWGVTNLLEAGHERPGGAWSEEGALLNLDFFGRLSQGGDQVLRVFLSTHPPAVIRRPVVQNAARQWQPGRRPIGLPDVDPNNPAAGLPGNLPIPGNLPSALPGLLNGLSQAARNAQAQGSQGTQQNAQ